jgi:hypothetical protein
MVFSGRTVTQQLSKTTSNKCVIFLKRKRAKISNPNQR